MLETAHTQLQGLGRLLQAFHDKNPQSTIVVDKDREGNLQRVFICPGAHKQVLDATLRISHNDAFHVKTHIINSNIAATSLLTNQRTNFLYCAAIFPVENVENWTWYMRCLDDGPLGEWLHSGKAIVMGDREKGESNAVHAVFEETLGASCTHHIKKNMLAQKIPCRKENRHIWYNVATVASLAERDEWWDMLKAAEPVQAAYLQDIDRAAWQNSERIARGFMTHFTIPKRVAQQGRPRVKRFKMGHTLRFKRKMRGQASLAAGRQCSVCLRLGHNKTACPVRNRFKL